MDEIGLVQFIGNEVCEGCGPNRDCELDYDDCSRIENALEALQDYVVQKR